MFAFEDFDFQHWQHEKFILRETEQVCFIRYFSSLAGLLKNLTDFLEKIQ